MSDTIPKKHRYAEPGEMPGSMFVIMQDLVSVSTRGHIWHGHVSFMPYSFMRCRYQIYIASCCNVKAVPDGRQALISIYSTLCTDTPRV